MAHTTLDIIGEGKGCLSFYDLSYFTKPILAAFDYAFDTLDDQRTELASVYHNLLWGLPLPSRVFRWLIPASSQYRIGHIPTQSRFAVQSTLVLCARSYSPMGGATPIQAT